ncbi:4-hydroxy-tetrahydrodipicolinate reductase [Candidatus Rariloculus sp.]|uniref:4-hydroxy-tetrahydrodipicolinate reductase n=1 Tax=Candidatus Rariloculus sp. TaxID=3101265 RepID=UPI003D09EC5B
MLKVAIIGAAGRMGKATLACLAGSDEMRLTGAVTEPGDPLLGRDAGDAAQLGPLGVALTDDRSDALHEADVAIDFTLPAALENNLDACEATGTALVIGTTGFSDAQLRLLERAARHIPLVYARNMSVGVNVFMDLVARAASVLGDGYDVEIVEAHHRFKVDAPSGTALALGERIAGATGRSLNDVAVMSRDGQIGPRAAGEIGFSVIRGGNIVGEHTVMYVGPEEQLEFRHTAQDRKTFARGALRAARWVSARPPGLYSMADVLGLSGE